MKYLKLFETHNTWRNGNIIDPDELAEDYEEIKNLFQEYADDMLMTKCDSVYLSDGGRYTIDGQYHNDYPNIRYSTHVYDDGTILISLYCESGIHTIVDKIAEFFKKLENFGYEVLGDDPTVDKWIHANSDIYRDYMKHDKKQYFKIIISI